MQERIVAEISFNAPREMVFLGCDTQYLEEHIAHLGEITHHETLAYILCQQSPTTPHYNSLLLLLRNKDLVPYH